MVKADPNGFAFQVSNETEGRDSVFTSGGYSLPRVSNNPTCKGAGNAVECLRSMAGPLTGANAFRISNFSGYLPSVINSLESIYGADEAEGLLVPTAGAVTYKLERSY